MCFTFVVVIWITLALWSWLKHLKAYVDNKRYNRDMQTAWYIYKEYINRFLKDVSLGRTYWQNLAHAKLYQQYYNH